MRNYHHKHYSPSRKRLETFSSRHQITKLDLQIEALTHDVALVSEHDDKLPEELPLPLSAIIKALDS